MKRGRKKTDARSIGFLFAAREARRRFINKA